MKTNLKSNSILLGGLLLLWYPKRKESTPFRWDWTIIGISVFLCAADFSNLQPGDLIFFGRKATPERKERVVHVGR